MQDLRSLDIARMRATTASSSPRIRSSSSATRPASRFARPSRTTSARTGSPGRICPTRMPADPQLQDRVSDAVLTTLGDFGAVTGSWVSPGPFSA
jgi:hypothetical protein